jgi:FkbM family methyltransferase
MIKRAIKRIFNAAGFDIVRTENSFSMPGALRRCFNRGLWINSVIDVGASDGRWSEICMKVFPDAEYLLIEAQEIHKPGLDHFRRKHPNADYILAAAGNKTGVIYFDNSDPFGGTASENRSETSCIEVPQTTIDQEISARSLKPPYMIKLDTHGYEVQILEGALKTLEQTTLLVVETYNYKLTPTSLRYFEMSAFMENIGFSSIEIADPLLRKKDGSFWQMDIFYIPSKSKEFSDVSFE